jgi:hypothetical protein
VIAAAAYISGANGNFESRIADRPRTADEEAIAAVLLCIKFSPLGFSQSIIADNGSIVVPGDDLQR